MKIFKGKRVKVIESFENFKKGQKFNVRKIKNEKIHIGTMMLTRELVEKYFVGLKPKSLKEVTKKDIDVEHKRILFPWMRTSEGKKFKAMLALVADKYGWDNVLSGDISYNAFLKTVIKKTNKLFPEMFNTIAKFYKEHGRIITEKEFVPIAMGRLSMMFRIDKNEKKLVRLPEHPTNSATKFGDVVNKCKKILEKND